LILIFFGSLLGSEPSFCRSRSERADAQTRDEPAFSIAFRNRRLLPDRVRPGRAIRTYDPAGANRGGRKASS